MEDFLEKRGRAEVREKLEAMSPCNCDLKCFISAVGDGSISTHTDACQHDPTGRATQGHTDTHDIIPHTLASSPTLTLWLDCSVYVLPERGSGDKI